MRYFNTAGPVNCADHYCLPPLERFDLAEVMMLIAQRKYFVLHAPRQTGKTTCLLALMAHLVIFDRTPGKPWKEKIFRQEQVYRDLLIAV